MSSRTPIQVPPELRDELNGMAETFRCKAQYEVIQKLLTYYHQAEKEKIALKAYQKEHMIELSKESKLRYQEIKEDLGLRTEDGVFEFLADCYQANLQIPIGAFETFTRLKREGK